VGGRGVFLAENHVQVTEILCFMTRRNARIGWLVVRTPMMSVDLFKMDIYPVCAFRRIKLQILKIYFWAASAGFARVRRSGLRVVVTPRSPIGKLLIIYCLRLDFHLTRV